MGMGSGIYIYIISSENAERIDPFEACEETTAFKLTLSLHDQRHPLKGGHQPLQE